MARSQSAWGVLVPRAGDDQRAVGALQGPRQQCPWWASLQPLECRPLGFGLALMHAGANCKEAMDELPLRWGRCWRRWS